MESKRITVQLKCPNPFFEMWLEEMYATAAMNDSKTRHKLQTALKSLRKYPLVLNSGSECAILKGFGKSICQILDNKLSRHNQNHLVLDSASSPLKEIKRKLPESYVNLDNQNHLDFDFASSPLKEIKRKLPDPVHLDNQNHLVFESASSPLKEIERKLPKSSVNLDAPPSTKKSKCSYVPGYRTGAYAILITLYKNYEREIKCMTKSAIQSEAQKLCDESMTKPKPGGSFYTAWSNMKTLLSKGFITKERKKVLYFSLTEEGRILSERLLSESDKIISSENENNVYVSNDKILDIDGESMKKVDGNYPPPESVHNKQRHTGVVSQEQFIFIPKSFDVVLLVDKQEISGAANKDDATIYELNKYKMIRYEMRHLKVGDFTWVAHHHETGRELVLPYIVERKRIDDLSGSIKDGRFHEQKFRLKKCGIPNLIYLVESYGNNKRTGLPLSTLMQAVTNTRVQDGFLTHYTPSLAGSIKFLAMMTKSLSDAFTNKTLYSFANENATATVSPENTLLMEFNYFNAMASKNKVLTVKDVFIKQLLQLKGISVEKAVAIVTLYKTPKNLMDAYKSCNDTSKAELLLAGIKYGHLKSKIGPSISKTLHRFFNEEVLL